MVALGGPAGGAGFKAGVGDQIDAIGDLENLDIVEQTWSQPAVCYEGKYYNFKNITVAPKPLQQPLPPIRIAAASPDTYPQVGERGLPIFINARYGSFSEFAPEIRKYREAYAA